MKRMRRIFIIMLAMMMVLGMGLTALADESYTITVKQNKDDKAVHTYEAYQIFSGVLAQNPNYNEAQTCEKEEHTHGADCYNTEGTLTCEKEEHRHTSHATQYILSDIQWGNGVVNPEGEDGLLAALKADTTIGADFAGCTTAASVAEVLADEYSSTSVGASGKLDTFASIVAGYLVENTPYNSGKAKAGDVTIEVNEVGYYLVKDVDDSLGGENVNDAAYTRNLLEVVGDSTMVVKSEVPSGDKKVFYTGLDAYNNPDKAEFVPADSNYAGIGDHVTYQITSKVPNYTGYDYYYFVMNDTMSEGLDFDGVNSVHVTVGGTELERGTDYYVYPDEDNYSFRLAFANIMEYPIGADIVVTYSAKVNENAIVGVTGNENAWSLQYSQNPNFDYNGTKDESKPGLPLNEATTPLGKTPDQKTLTYLTELDITKYADEVLPDNLLAGAEFTLTGTSYQVMWAKVKDYLENVNGTYYKLKDGSYTETAPTEDSYVAIGIGDENTEEGYLKDGDTYRVPENKADYVGQTIYKLVEGSTSLYEDTNKKYIEVETEEERISRVPSQVSMTLTTGVDGKISFKGLGEGKYTLTETVTPEGFNTIEPITFEITFKSPGTLTNNEVSTGKEVCEWEITGWTKDENGNQTIANNGGIFSANIINVGGALLPSTGGIGTTIFYVVGGVLVFVAVVLLVARKRMSKEQ